MVSLNINLASELGVYCKIALRVPCLTSFLLLASNYSSSTTTSGVRAIYDCSYSIYSVGFCINKDKIYITHHEILCDNFIVKFNMTINVYA